MSTIPADSNRTITGVLAADIATNGTLVVSYPSGTDKSNYTGAGGHRWSVGGQLLRYPKDFEVTLGLTSATLTYRGTATLLAGSTSTAQLEMIGDQTPFESRAARRMPRVRTQNVVEILLGAPILGAVTQVATVQLKGAAGTLTLDGTFVVGGVAIADVPRNFTLSVATTNQSGVTFTVTGTDEYGMTMVETLAGPNNNTVVGNKAFKTITSVANSAAIATDGVSVGFGAKLGLPIAIRQASQIIKEKESGAVATAGTLVLAGIVTPTATSADIRGTYTPNSAADSSKTFQLTVTAPDIFDLGTAQFGAVAPILTYTAS